MEGEGDQPPPSPRASTPSPTPSIESPPPGSPLNTGDLDVGTSETMSVTPNPDADKPDDLSERRQVNLRTNSKILFVDNPQVFEDSPDACTPNYAEQSAAREESLIKANADLVEELSLIKGEVSHFKDLLKDSKNFNALLQEELATTKDSLKSERIRRVAAEESRNRLLSEVEAITGSPACVTEAPELDISALSSPSPGPGADVIKTSELESRIRAQALEIDALRSTLGEERELILQKEVAQVTQEKEDVIAELEELTMELFLRSNEMVADEARARYELEQVKTKLEVELANTNDLYTLGREELSKLKDILYDEQSKRTEMQHMAVRARTMSFVATTSAPNSPISAALSASNASAGSSISSLAQTRKARLSFGSKSPKKQPDEPSFDPMLNEEFKSFLESPVKDYLSHSFISRVIREDIGPAFCLSTFANKFRKQLHEGAQQRSVYIESLGQVKDVRQPAPGATAQKEAAPAPPSEESLAIDVCGFCSRRRHIQFKARTNPKAGWKVLCSYCRERVVAVCDFYNQMHYIKNGIIRDDERAMFLDTLRLRKAISMATLRSLGPK